MSSERTCAEMQACYDTCTGDDSACTDACRTSGSDSAQALDDALWTCIAERGCENTDCVAAECATESAACTGVDPPPIVGCGDISEPGECEGDMLLTCEEDVLRARNCLDEGEGCACQLNGDKHDCVCETLSAACAPACATGQSCVGGKCIPDPSGCCASKSDAGCSKKAACESCVCGADSYCCSTSWDSICAGIATGSCVSSCGCGAAPPAATGGAACAACKSSQDCKTGLSCRSWAANKSVKYCAEKCKAGKCATGYTCAKSGYCIPKLTKECKDGNVWDKDGCGNFVVQKQACAAGQTCSAGACKAGTCTPTCQGKQCGGDGCGGTCGTCGSGKTCQNGLCASGTPGDVTSVLEQAHEQQQVVLQCVKDKACADFACVVQQCVKTNSQACTALSADGYSPLCGPARKCVSSTCTPHGSKDLPSPKVFATAIVLHLSDNVFEVAQSAAKLLIKVVDAATKVAGTGNVVATGTLTEAPGTAKGWTYASGPSQSLVVNLADGSVYELAINIAQGSWSYPDSFLKNPHKIEAVIHRAGHLHIAYSADIAKEGKGTRSVVGTLTLTPDGTEKVYLASLTRTTEEEYVNASSGGSISKDKHSTTGFMTSSGLQAILKDDVNSHVGITSYTLKIYTRGADDAWVFGADAFALQKGYWSTKYNDGWKFAEWSGKGTLLENGTEIGSIVKEVIGGVGLITLKTKHGDLLLEKAP